MQFEDEFAADNYAGDYMVQSDVARIMDSAARLTMMTPPDETYSEWWKSQSSVVADKIDGLADYLEDRYAGTKPTAWMPKLGVDFLTFLHKKDGMCGLVIGPIKTLMMTKVAEKDKLEQIQKAFDLIGKMEKQGWTEQGFQDTVIGMSVWLNPPRF